MRTVASVRHTVILVFVLGLISYGGYANQSSVTAERSSNLPLYASIAISEWALFYFAWRGMRAHGVGISEVMGGRWGSWKDVARDVIIAALFFFVATALLRLYVQAVGSHASNVGAILPRGMVEKVVWVFLSITAGICEEWVFRGYLQRQFTALSRSVVVGIFAQAVTFGVTHGYQGLQATLRITVYAALFGILAHWRRSLRPGMIAHAWQDVFSGILVR